MNIGGSEFLVIAALVLLLFGPSLLAFWFGYILGQRKGEEPAEKAAEPSPANEAPAAPALETPVSNPAATATSDSAPAEDDLSEEGTHD
jgi:Sec-independent protein translocase protein TatA